LFVTDNHAMAYPSSQQTRQAPTAVLHPVASIPPAIVWLRHDLRWDDNPALAAALATGGAVYPLFIHDPAAEGAWPIGAASRWFLHHALGFMQHTLANRGLPLLVRVGDSSTVLDQVIEQTGARAVFWCRRYESHAAQRDATIKSALRNRGLRVESFNGSLLFEPWTVASGTGKAYRVYTPFSKELAKRPMPQPVRTLPPSDRATLQPASGDGQPRPLPALGSLLDLNLLPTIPWANGLAQFWLPLLNGGPPAWRLRVREKVAAYAALRDTPSVDGTFRLSPLLRWGLVGPRQVVDWVSDLPDSAGKQTLIRELLWREFAYHVLFHFPATPTEPLQTSFASFPWQPDDRLLRAWQRGTTGYPIVDAGMRELWHTGWMHNRVRMVVASFLVKHLLQPWQAGAAWFWDTLVDADLASNTLGWQWAAGCGADAAPFFRIFNPTLQARKFDPDGTYIRRWVPTLATVAAPTIHEPHATANSLFLPSLRPDYPAPIVDHPTARARALATLKAHSASQA
jgi:deoxyribodipyrimidine photo-lyase